MAELEVDPHPLLRELREREPVSWIPALERRRSEELCTGELPRGGAHRTGERRRGKEFCTGELRRGFAGPLAATVISLALGLRRDDVPAVLECYGEIVSDVTAITAGTSAGTAGRLAYERLSGMLLGALREGSDSLLAAAAASGTRALSREQVMANAAVLLFGGIETTEGMIANALLHLLERPQVLAAVRTDPRLLSAAIEESLRLEPAAAVIDRYASRDAKLGGATVASGELVRISIAAANRDPAVFADPDRFRLDRPNARRHLAFAQGPHVCVGVHLARLEARTAIAMLLQRLSGLRLDSTRPAQITGLVFRKPVELHVLWES